MEYGLVLGGGGAKGAFEIGVWKALKTCSTPITAVIGTSVGALNAAVIAQNDYQLAYQFWTNLSIDQVLALNKKMNDSYEKIAHQGFDLFRLNFLDILFSNGLDISPLRKNLHALISEEKIRASPIRLGLVTVDLTSLRPRELMIEDIPEGQLIDYLLASSALPIFQKHEIDGNRFLDGAFFDILPVNFMIRQGYDNIIAVDLPSFGVRRPIRNKEVEILNISNSQIVGGLLDFCQETTQTNINLGYLDGMKALKQFVGIKYYLDLSKNKQFFTRFKNRLGETLSNHKQDQKMLSFLFLPQDASKDMILKALEDLKAKTDFKNSDLSLAMLEMTAKNLGVPVLKDYQMDSFILAILKRLKQLLEENALLIKTPDLISELITANYKRYHFTLFYLIFLALKQDLLIEKIPHFIQHFTADMVLSLITLVYIHDSLQKKDT